MIRAFFELWLVITACVFGWMWLAPKEEKILAKVWIRRAAISGVVALSAIGGLLLLNNISGV